MLGAPSFFMLISLMFLFSLPPLRVRSLMRFPPPSMCVLHLTDHGPQKRKVSAFSQQMKLVDKYLAEAKSYVNDLSKPGNTLSQLNDKVCGPSFQSLDRFARIDSQIRADRLRAPRPNPLLLRIVFWGTHDCESQV